MPMPPDTGPTFRVHRRAEHHEMPWRNGGGTTREVTAAADDAGFLWRVSFADVHRSGPFSAFPGVDRVITLVDGPALDLVVAGRPHRLDRWQPFAFPGEADTAAVVSGPSTDFNVMVRRDRYRMSTTLLELAVEGPVTVAPAGDDVIVAVLEGAVAARGAVACELGALDVLHAGGSPVRLSGSGTVQVTRLHPQEQPGRLSRPAPGAAG